MRLNRPLDTPYVAYVAASMAVLAAVLATLIGLGGRTGQTTGGGEVLSLVSGDIPLHSVEVRQTPDGQYKTLDGMTVTQLAGRIRSLPPEVPVPVVMVRISASTELKSVAPILKEMEAAGIKKIAILLE
ncbi:MAG: hypothetical protein JW909_02865 [Planctomycetes bacterium]|nr:hypothetical protein [Planctomycetota bacterium]